jgi:hypothetical protein
VAEGLLHIVDHRTPAWAIQRVDLAARFAEASVWRIQLDELRSASDLQRSIAGRNVGGIVMSAVDDRVPPAIDVWSAIGATFPVSVPVLVDLVAPEASAGMLERWSEGQIRACRPLTGETRVRFSNDVYSRRLVRQLSGTDVPYSATSGCLLEQPARSESIMSAQVPPGGAALVLLTTALADRPIFFLSPIRLAENLPWGSDYVEASVWETTPLLVFMERCGIGWRPPVGHQASFVIDDAWLREPYGHLSYAHLLAEMKKANFHTSIAFIPWYFDQSSPQVAELIRSNPQWYSISVHGNNHSITEFSPDETDAFYERNIAQSLARMDRFTQLTRVPYDRVMVFPRGVVPLKGFAFLQRHNFLATVNGSNVPLGGEVPPDVLFYMRPATVLFKEFLSVRRYQVGSIRRQRIALELFLGNPLIFYAHQDFFRKGANAFNETARLVNELEPSIKWTSLAEIAREQYRVRRIANGLQVTMFSPSVRLANREDKPQKVEVRIAVSTGAQLARGMLNGRPLVVERRGEYWRATLSLPAQSNSLVEIQYPVLGGRETAELGSGSPTVYLTRRLSDLRDIYLTRSIIGQKVVSLYYLVGRTRSGLVIVLLMTCASGLLLAITLRRRRRPGALAHKPRT